MRLRHVLGAALAALSLAAPSVALAGDAEPRGTIVEVARKAGKFKTLLKALEATGLDEALSGEGPFTVFAPTDDAFAALPEGTLEKLLADKPKLTAILKYHVARGSKLADEVVQYDAAGTLEGSKLSIVAKSGEVRVGGARVVKADVKASNGVIHVIDKVLLPPTPKTIVEVARGAGSFTTLVKVLETTGLDKALAGEGPFTVFAPTDEAFAKVPQAALEALLADREKLAAVLKYHVVAGRVLAKDVVELRSAKTLEGRSVTIDAGETVRLDGARVVKTDILASNGVIHVIDSVLIPKECGARFPELEARSLARVTYSLPGDLEGEKNLCLVAFEMWQQSDIDTWLEWLAESPLAEAKGFHYYEMPTIEPRGKAFERMLDDGMRSGIPSREARARTITLYTDKATFKRSLGIKTERKIQALLVDKEGRILWRSEGRFTDEKGEALVRAVEGR